MKLQIILSKNKAMTNTCHSWKYPFFIAMMLVLNILEKRILNNPSVSWIFALFKTVLN